MNRNGISRKDFLQGAMAAMGLGFLGGRRIFAVPSGWVPDGEANLVFGVVSDTHIRTDWNTPYSPPRFWRTCTAARFRHAMSFFHDQNVDAVMHCGDWADRGGVEEMEKHKVVWDEIFLSDSTKPPPVKLFVLGNHDFFNEDWMEGYWNARNEDYQNHLLRNNTEVHMKTIWGEDYSPAWHKVVKGYHFFGYNFAKTGESFVANGKAMAALIAEERAKPDWDVRRPFFTMSHYVASSTVTAAVTAALNLREGEYCSGINFIGHEHISNAIWNSISWQAGACFPSIQCGTIGDKGWGGESDTPVFAQGFGDGRAEGVRNSDACHGLLVKVYDSCIVVTRLDLYSDTGNYQTAARAELAHNQEGIGVQPVGPDWVIALDEIAPGTDGAPASHPFLSAGLLKLIGSPEFRSGAKLQTYYDDDRVRIEIPNADGNRDASGRVLSRVYGYNLEIVGQCGVVRKSVFANGYNFGYGYEPNGGVTTVLVPKSELPIGENLTIRVWPCSMLGTRGSPLTKSLKCVRVLIEKTTDVARQKRFALTSGARLPADTCVIADMPPWIRCVCVEDGDIVAYTRTSDGAVLRLKSAGRSVL